MMGSMDGLLQGGLMLPLFTDGVDMSNSSSSPSTEERHSNTPGSDQGEGDGRQRRRPGMKKEKNRESARKSRKKQTERADQLHQELESLEGSNSALRKEIASLEKQALFYTTALELHQAFCRLQGPGSDSAAPLSVSCQASTSAPSPLTPAPAAQPYERFPSGGSETSLPSSFLTAPASHSLFHPPDPPPPTPCPVSIPQTHPDPLVDNPINSKPSYSHHSAASPGLPLSLLTVPSPPRTRQTSAGPSDGPLAQQEDTDLGFLELLEYNEWILQEAEMNPAVSNQQT